MSKARVSISAIDPIANVTYELPVAAVSYIELVAAVEVDTTGRHRYVVDSFAVGDARVIDFAKRLQSASTITDAISTIGTLKSLAESITVPDNFEALLVTIVELYSSAAISDDDVVFFAKNLVETILVTESKEVDYSKPVDETVTVPDAVAGDYHAPKESSATVYGLPGVLGQPTTLLNAYVLNEDFGRERVFNHVGKNLSHAISPLDVYDRVLVWDKTYADSQGLSDDEVIDFNKAPSDIFVMLDSAIAQLILERSLASSVNFELVEAPLNVQTLNFGLLNAVVDPEYQVVTYQKNLVESVLIAEEILCVNTPPGHMLNAHALNTFKLNASI